MRIALVTNSPYRDLPAAVLLAMRLCQTGAVCFIVPTFLGARELWSLAPDYVLLENFRTYSQDLAKHLMQAGIRVGILDTEESIFHDVEWYGSQLGRDPAVRYAISCFCTWGIRMAEHAVEKRWFLESQVRVTGTPRLDFYVEPWRQAALRLSSGTAVCPPPMVLIAANFDYSNPSSGDTEQALQTRRRLPGQNEASLRQWLDTDRQTMHQMAELANHLAARLPDVHFVYRPHPFENPDTYNSLLERLPNLHLIKQGTVDGWILRAAAVIQKGCTTAIEATLAGVPALSPAWIPTPVEVETIEAVSIPCASEDDLVDSIRSAVAGAPVLSERVLRNLDTVLSGWFHVADGRAHDRAAQAILDSAARPQGPVSLDRCRDMIDGLAGPRPGWAQRARALARRALGLPVSWSFRRWRDTPDLTWDHSPRAYGLQQVQDIVEAIQPAASRMYGPSWRPVAVESALQRGDYHFGYSHGRSIALTPAT